MCRLLKCSECERDVASEDCVVCLTCDHTKLYCGMCMCIALSREHEGHDRQQWSLVARKLFDDMKSQQVYFY